METLTPMMRQYKQLKEKYSDAFLFFRLGDFYELFFEDAVECSRLLNLTLTKRQTAPMCGIPHHAVDSYLGRLTKVGKKVAICEQLSDPSLPGIVERDVVKVVTPGTTFDERILEQKANNFIAAVASKDGKIGLALCDMTTGFFQAVSKKDEEGLAEEIYKWNPAECILDAAAKNIPEFLKRFEKMAVFPHQMWDEPADFLARHFGVKNLSAFGIEANGELIEACALLLHYLKETQKCELVHIRPPQILVQSDHLVLDDTALKNLEIFSNMRDGKQEGSLLSIIDLTLTPMGGRTLRRWLLSPLKNASQIEMRLDSISEFIENFQLKDEVHKLLSNVLDMERLLSRIAVGSGSARDMIGIAISLQSLGPLKSALAKAESKIFAQLLGRLGQLESLEILREEILKTVVENPPLSLKEGGLVRDGINKDLDELRKIAGSGKDFISKLQKTEIEKTGINSLKIRYNHVFGYYIEITKSNLGSAPPHYIRKQTLANCERFITPELKEYEEKILGAETKINELEYQIILQLRENVKNSTKEIQATAQIFGVLDCLLSLALAASKNGYCRPKIGAEGSDLIIKNGRHPVVERLAGQRFVPNDTNISASERVILLTGPNMGGKSTYLRQVALIALLGHVGSFVPAQEAEIPLMDRIFTRVGASDNLARGQSTFMVEMQETAQILHCATRNSLIILDEIGRGTSTYDGVSLAWAILEHIHDQVGAKTLFATHYHELIGVAEKLSAAENCSVSVSEDNGKIVFLYRILKGAVDRSYGIEVARLAGLPKEVVNKARNILNDLEEGILDEAIANRAKAEISNPDQLAIFAPDSRTHRVIEELKNVDINTITPLEALHKLDRLKNDL